jgi:hypothetical protein
MKKATKGMYLRIAKEAIIDIPEGMTYEEALAYAHQQDADGGLPFDMYIDVMDEDGEVVEESELCDE